MPNHWFTADSHFNHDAIIYHSGRPFPDVETMNGVLIANWNDSVRPGDNVYHLGDFSWGNREDALRIKKQLNGTIHLIEGNHDGAAFQIRTRFQWYKQMHTIDVLGQKIVLCHYSLETWNRSHYGAWHLYGHSHNSLRENPYRRSFDVGVDAVAARIAGIPQGTYLRGTPDERMLPKNYRPISYDEVAGVMNEKLPWVAVDHHGREQTVLENDPLDRLRVELAEKSLAQLE